MQNKIFYWIILTTCLILMIPLAAMQLTNKVVWTLEDFMVMGSLIFGTGFVFIHVARIMPRKYRTLAAIAFFVMLLLIWAELAVGIFGTPFAGS